VKTKIRPEHASALEVNDWLAGLRDGESAGPADPGEAGPAGPGPGGLGHAVPPSYGHGVPAGPGHAEPVGYVRAVPADHGYAVPAGHGCAGPSADRTRPETLAGPVAPALPAATTTPASPAGSAVRCVIGDELRIPVMWCEMGSCVSWHADPAALGEADTRARAIAAGWRIDALGRLACPQCQQSNPGFWASRPVAVRDRDMALARTAPITAVPGADADGGALPGSRNPGRAGPGHPASQAELEWHRDHPDDDAHPRWQVSGKPRRRIHSLAMALNPARVYGGRQAAPRQDREHSEDLMVRESACARPDGAMTSTGQ
jgi:hypothetical protein